MMRTAWNSLDLFAWFALVSASTLPVQALPRTRSLTLPLAKSSYKISARDGSDVVGGTVGLGDQQDFFYTVALTIGNTTTTANLDTGSADLWVIDSACLTPVCENSTATRYDTATFRESGGTVQLKYGDSTTGTHANGVVGRDDVTIAGLVMKNQTLAAVSDTDNSAVVNNAAGIVGLGFFSQSFVQASVISAEIQNIGSGTDTFVEQTANSGPVVTRLALSGAIAEPMFSIMLQRDTIDVSGEGVITIGELPKGIDNSSLTWVPVRLYDSSVGGLDPPSFAPQEVYPLRWEVELDGVFLDGQELPLSTQTATGIPNPSLSALIDTGNSLLRGPTDVVNNILSKVSPAFAADSSARPLLPCTDGHELAFGIGGKRFPVDPRDFVAQGPVDNTGTPQCSADNIVGTDAPQSGALFSWNIGDPLMKSTLVVFYYGNMTHPSVDPPRMGFLSLVPANADDLLDDAVTAAQKDGGRFESTTDAAPTASSLIRQSDVLTTATTTAGSGTASASGSATGNKANGQATGSATSSNGAPTSTQPNAASSLYPQRAQNGIRTMVLPLALSLLLSLSML
ncbi:acid protease [Lenzites betulinus]|nr:acid protease [Lenzites betulinus]